MFIYNTFYLFPCGKGIRHEIEINSILYVMYVLSVYWRNMSAENRSLNNIISYQQRIGQTSNKNKTLLISHFILKWGERGVVTLESMQSLFHISIVHFTSMDTKCFFKYCVVLLTLIGITLVYCTCI